MREAFRQPDSVMREALVNIWRLYVRAEELAGISQQLGVRTFVSGEPYLIEVDAIQVAAQQAKVRTLTYQYSSLARFSPSMMSTADEMALFSSTFEGLWDYDGIRPVQFRVTGYLFDGVAHLVRARSMKLRKRLEGAGVRFVLCYFDESVQSGNWGLVNEVDHRGELEQLADLVLGDPRFGLIVKSQFERTSPSRLYARDSLFKRLAQTGRYEELCLGTHRNVIYPTEGALAADLSIGHIFGATAALEAAVAGCRAVLLNRYGLKTAHNHLYEKAPVVYTDLGSVLEAVRDEINGNARFPRVGDWEPIIDQLAPFRDGRAAERMRSWVTQATMRSAEPH